MGNHEPVSPVTLPPGSLEWAFERAKEHQQTMSLGIYQSHDEPPRMQCRSFIHHHLEPRFLSVYTVWVDGTYRFTPVQGRC